MAAGRLRRRSGGRRGSGHGAGSRRRLRERARRGRRPRGSADAPQAPGDAVARARVAPGAARPRRRLATVARAGAGLAHQIRNPLAVVKGTAQLLEERVPDGERERAARIVAASGRIETILSRLLDFARPPAPQPTTFDLAGLARTVAARSGGTEGPGEGAALVRADREHVETILEELLANARAFDPDGRIEVSVRRAPGGATLDVADRGPGLSVDPASAFEPYVTSRPDGTGLGLAIVKSLAAANGGRVTLAARAGGGCVASLTLPLAEG